MRISHMITIINIAFKSLLLSDKPNSDHLRSFIWFCKTVSGETITLCTFFYYYETNMLCSLWPWQKCFQFGKPLMYQSSSAEQTWSTILSIWSAKLSHRSFQAISFIAAESDSLAKDIVFRKGWSSYYGFSINRILWYNNMRTILSILWRAWPRGYVRHCNRGLEWILLYHRY